MTTTTTIVLDVLGTPAPQGSKRAYVRGGRAFLVESSKNGVDRWRGDVIRAAVEALPGIDAARITPGFRPLLDGPIAVDIEFYLDRPKSHWRTGGNAHLLRDTAPTYPASKPDIDKLARGTLDALTTAGIWRDDSQVVDLRALKTWAGRPGATIRIHALP